MGQDFGTGRLLILQSAYYKSLSISILHPKSEIMFNIDFTWQALLLIGKLGTYGNKCKENLWEKIEEMNMKNVE